MHLVYFALMKEQFTRALGLVIIAVAVRKFGDVGVDQPDLMILHLGIGLRDRSFAEAQRLHFGTGQRDPGLKDRLDIIFIPRAPVLGDGFDFLGDWTGTGHGGSM